MLGEKMKTLRKEKNETQKDIAEKYNVTESTVSTWETGKAKPDYEIIASFAKDHGVTVDYLVDVDYDKLEKLKSALKENNLMVGNDLTIEELQKALSIVEMMKDTNK